MKYRPRFQCEHLVLNALSSNQERTLAKITALAYPDYDPRLEEIRLGRVKAHLD